MDEDRRRSDDGQALIRAWPQSVSGPIVTVAEPPALSSGLNLEGRGVAGGGPAKWLTRKRGWPAPGLLRRRHVGPRTRLLQYLQHEPTTMYEASMNHPRQPCRPQSHAPRTFS